MGRFDSCAAPLTQIFALPLGFRHCLRLAMAACLGQPGSADLRYSGTLFPSAFPWRGGRPWSAGSCLPSYLARQWSGPAPSSSSRSGPSAASHEAVVLTDAGTRSKPNKRETSRMDPQTPSFLERVPRISRGRSVKDALPLDVANAADRWPVADRGVRSPVVVVLEPVFHVAGSVRA